MRGEREADTKDTKREGQICREACGRLDKRSGI